MDTTTLNAIIAGVVGLIAGAIGSLIAPWIQWGIEKNRIRQQRRIELIYNWREILSREDFQRDNLLNNPSYGPLRELLNKSIRERFERSTNEIVVLLDSAKNSYDRDVILKEVARIEKEWDLI